MLSDGTLRSRFLARDALDAAAVVQLDFQRRLFRKGGVTAKSFGELPGASFSRASTGLATAWRGDLKSFASGALRNNDRGALIEAAGTNRIAQSQAIDNALWLKERVTVVGNAGVAPDGTATADRLVVTGPTNANAFVYPLDTTSVTGIFNFSLYIRPVGIRRVSLDDQTGTGWVRASFDLAAGTVVSNLLGSNARITPLAGGWFRISCDTVNKAGSGAIYPTLFLSADDGDYPVATGSAGAFVWGAQLTAGAGEQSHIPTTGAATTRLADVATLTITPPTACTIIADIAMPPSAGRHQALVGLAGGYMPLFFNAGGGDLRTFSASGEFSLNTGVPVRGQPYRAAIAYNNTTVYGCGTGADAVSQAAGATPDLTTLYMGGRPGSEASLGGFLRRVLVYDHCFTPSELLAAIGG